MSNDTKLNNASSYFFFSGFIVSKIKYLPVPLVSPILNLISLFLYLVGYCFWFISSHFYPSQEKKESEWYGFAQFKEQYLYAAALGLVATSISLIAIFLPILLVPAGWIFLGSNIIWTIGEYHKLNNPPSHEEHFSQDRQSVYVSYALSMTLIGFITATSTTLAFFLPVITIPLLISTTLICIGVGSLAFKFWLESKFGDFQPPCPNDASYKQMNNDLGKKIHSEPDLSMAPYHGSSPLNSKSHNAKEKELSIDHPLDLPIQTCKKPH